jgi:hypothetical protein
MIKNCRNEGNNFHTNLDNHYSIENENLKKKIKDLNEKLNKTEMDNFNLKTNEKTMNVRLNDL